MASPSWPMQRHGISSVTPALTAILVALLLTTVIARIVLPLIASETSAPPHRVSGQGPPPAADPGPKAALVANLVLPTKTATAEPSATIRAVHRSTATAAPSPTATPGRAGAQLVRNGGFESGTDGWRIDPGVTVVTGDAHRGDSAIQITWSGGFADQPIAYTPGTTYTLSAWGRTSLDGDPGSIGVVYRDADGVRLQALEPPPLSFDTPAYAKRTMTFVPPPGAATVHIFAGKAPGLATFTADDLSVRSVATDAAATPTARPPSG